MIIRTIAACAAILFFSAGSYAAKPTSIAFVANGQTDEGTPFATYTVKCSNGQQAELTAWNKRRKWCVGDAVSEQCEKKQIKAAKTACK